MERKAKSLTFKGGKGNPAPYDSMMIRIPAPIKLMVQALSEAFRRYALANNLKPGECDEFQKALVQAMNDDFVDLKSGRTNREKRLILENRVAYLERKNAELENRVAYLERENAELENRLEEFVFDDSASTR